MSYITHQTQPCNTSCMSTCLAMVTNKPAQDVINQYHEKYRSKCTSIRSMLDSLGVPFTSFDTADHVVLGDVGVYMVTVPSLNIVAGNHQILIEVRDFDYLVHDPVQGREGRYYYVPRGQADGAYAIELGGFMVEAFISWTWLKDRP